jgi:hypothetical protein
MAETNSKKKKEKKKKKKKKKILSMGDVRTTGMQLSVLRCQ